MYIDSQQDNMWEQYFKPLSNVSVEDALKSHRVISVKDNYMDWRSILINPYVRKLWNCPEDHPRITFTDEIQNYFWASMPKEILDKKHRVLGAFVRGTDGKNALAKGYEIDTLISECREIMEKEGFDRLFLATEDAAYFEAFRNVFKSKILYVEQKRVISSEKREAIGKLLNIKEGERRNFGQTYLLVTYCLSQCSALAYNMQSGGYYLAGMWRGKPYGLSWMIRDRRTEFETMVECLKIADENTRIAVYGTGNIGKRLVNIFNDRYSDRIVFCDQRAENGQCLFCGYGVIKPSSLLEEYRKGIIQRVIVASADYAEEIYNWLTENGVNREHIFVAENPGRLI